MFLVSNCGWHRFCRAEGTNARNRSWLCLLGTFWPMSEFVLLSSKCQSGAESSSTGILRLDRCYEAVVNEKTQAETSQ